MRWSSIRIRLTLWNTFVFALILAGLGAILCYTVRADVQRATDRELARSARRIQEWAEREPEDFQRRDDRAEERQAPDRSAATSSPSPGAGNAPGSSPGASSPSPDRRGGPGPSGLFRRPRVLDLQGRPLRRSSGDGPWDPAAFARSAAGESLYSEVEAEGEPFRVYSVPLRINGKIGGVIQAAMPLADQQRLNDGLIRRLLTLIPLALLIAALGGIFLTERALRPVRKINQAAAQLGAEDLSQRLEVTGKDELAELAVTFNGMIARLDEAFRKLEGAYHDLEAAYEHQRRFTGDASHELCTPLARIKMSTSLALSRERTPEEYRQAIQAADQAADAMNRIVQNLLLLSQSDAGRLDLDRCHFSLEEILQKSIASVPNQKGVPIHLELPEDPLQVYADPDYLVRLVVNLLENAVRHTPRDGRITVSAELVKNGGVGEWGNGGGGPSPIPPFSHSPTPPFPTVVIRIQDTGEGIPPEHMPHVCERFYRVDPSRSRAGHLAGGGTGLGLAICQSIVEAHGGTMTIRSEVGRGTTVTVTLPQVNPAVGASSMALITS
jgi:signal transduction histidine kinase